MIEDKHLLILQLCNILNSRRQNEVKLSRARWRVAYLRKIKSFTQKKTTSLPDGYSKWKDNVAGLYKKIEEARLEMLSIQKSVLDAIHADREPLQQLLNEANAQLLFRSGEIVGLMVERDQIIFKSKFQEMADQYESAVAFNKVLDF